MNVQEQIKAYIATLPEVKRADIEALHKRILQLWPKCKLWFLNGKDDKGKVVSNPNIGYGFQTKNMLTEKPKHFIKSGSVQPKQGFLFTSLASMIKHIWPKPRGKNWAKRA